MAPKLQNGLPKKLNRYTNLPSAIDMLTRKKLTLLNPDSWDDENDSFVIKQYKAKKGLARVEALCFSQQSERYHHWKVFADGSSGVCIEFDGLALISRLDELDKAKRKVASWPFLKRAAFCDEHEFRFLFESSEDDGKPKEIPFTLDCIRRITLSPWLHRRLFDTVAQTLRDAAAGSQIRIIPSTLLTASRWRDHFV